MTIQTHQHLHLSLTFLHEVVNRRLQNYFNAESRFTFPEIKIDSGHSLLNRFHSKYALNVEEYVIVLLALCPHLYPNFLDQIIQQYLPQGGDFPEIGGVKQNNHRGMLPTGETAQFILAGNDLNSRLHTAHYFSSEHFFSREHILSLEPVKDGEPAMSGRMILSQEYVEWLTTGKTYAPKFSQDFPAKLIETQMTWDDLVLRPTTINFIDDIKVWLQNNEALMNDPVISRKIKLGYRALFYGPSGTGKTLTASLLGKQFQRDVYRIDLSQVVSKFIGETEKNLERIFSKAGNKNWILFFDEADALFGKRSGISSAHDKYANQEVSYLLQRIEDYPGLIILASNFKNNIDAAFLRRFNSVIHFPVPDASERLTLWHKNCPSTITMASDINLKFYADKYELSGSSITNIMQYACLHALNRTNACINNEDVINGIRRELIKEDKIQ